MKEAACVLIYNEYGQILAVSRKDDPTAFGLPGGKVDPGETSKEAAIREAKEETGLDVWDLVEVYTRVVEGDVEYNAVTFLAQYDPKQKIGPDLVNAKGEEETGRVEWVTWIELLRGPFGKYNRRILENEVIRR